MTHLEDSSAWGKNRCDEIVKLELIEHYLSSITSHVSLSTRSEESRKAYFDGDEARLLASQAHFTDQTDHCLFRFRHDHWVPQIVNYHEIYSPAFIAVGVGHMITQEDNLLERLRERGFQVEAIDRLPAQK